MALFHFGKKKEEKANACCCKAENTAPAETAASACCGETIKGICCVKVLGAGCKFCHQQYENAKAAVAALGLNVEVEYITDLEKVMTYGAIQFPGIVVNDRVASMGRVLTAGEVEMLLQGYLK